MRRSSLAVVLIIMALIPGADGHTREPSPDRDPLFFESSDLLHLTITAPFRSLLREREADGDEYEGELVLHSEDGSEAGFAVGLTTRGITRLSRDTCRFPPLRVNFRQSALDGTILEGQNRLKLVTHCRDSDRYEQYYVVEYLIYRVYNILTEASFRVRPAEITYVDSEGRRDDVTRFAFFIEDIDDVASRHGLEELEVPSLRQVELDPDAAALASLFHYMIGNLDWSLLRGPVGDDCCHNTKLIAGEGRRAIPIPYDFDFSGAVNTSYAHAPEGVQVRNVRQRLYRGFCLHLGQLDATVERFQETRQAVGELLAGEPLLSERTLNRVSGYFEDFYELIDSPRNVDRRIRNRCRS